MRRVIIISGPTCSGKTARALELARSRNAEIISCDSVQIYRGMDIGSAKPSADERAEIRHWLVDVAEPYERFDVSKYAELARAALDDILSRGKEAIVAGGSGFYLRSWFGAVVDNVKIPPDVFSVCAQIEESGGANGLAAALLKLDPDAGKIVDMLNPRRTRKALERCMASGKSCAALAEQFAALPCPMGELDRTVEILDVPNAVLAEKIAARTRNMLDSGLIDETKKLLACGIEKNPSARGAIGYRETISFVKSGESDCAKLAEEINLHTLALVKKQRKYFRNALKIFGVGF